MRKSGSFAFGIGLGWIVGTHSIRIGSMRMNTVHPIDPERPIRLSDVDRMLNDPFLLELDPKAREKIRSCREWLENHLETAAHPVYGVNTGFGSVRHPDRSPCTDRAAGEPHSLSRSGNGGGHAARGQSLDALVQIGCFVQRLFGHPNRDGRSPVAPFQFGCGASGL